MHAAKLIEQIKRRDPDAAIMGFGGERMRSAGCEIIRDLRHLAFMGFQAVLLHWRDVRDNFCIAREELLRAQPDALILIDYPSFNLQMAQFCKRHLPATKIYYYIPPKVWAWKKRRIHRIAKLCDRVLGIFPFEPDFYRQYGYECTYVGNPTVEEIEEQRAKTAALKEQRTKTDSQNEPRTKTDLHGTKTIAILPGSRRSEISHCIERMLEAARRFEGYEIIVTAASGIEESFYTPYLHTGERVTRDTYGTLQTCSAAIVNSGTATLEAALLGCPQVAVYHLACSKLIGLLRPVGQKIFFSIPYFTLVNIISGKEVIRECLANEFTVENVSAELEQLLYNEAHKKEMFASYEHLYSVLGVSSASQRAAEIITSKP